jgi:hypothetical protein
MEIAHLMIPYIGIRHLIMCAETCISSRSVPIIVSFIKIRICRQILVNKGFMMLKCLNGHLYVAAAEVCL